MLSNILSCSSAHPLSDDGSALVDCSASALDSAPFVVLLSTSILDGSEETFVLSSAPPPPVPAKRQIHFLESQLRRIKNNFRRLDLFFFYFCFLFQRISSFPFVSANAGHFQVLSEVTHNLIKINIKTFDWFSLSSHGISLMSPASKQGHFCDVDWLSILSTNVVCASLGVH